MNEKSSRHVAAIVFWLLLVSLALLPAFIPALVTSNAFNIFSLFAVILSIGAWVHFDARVYNVSVGPAMRALIVLLAFIAVPIYVFRTRGLQGGVHWSLKVLGMFALSVLLIGLTLLTFGAVAG